MGGGGGGLKGCEARWRGIELGGILVKVGRGE